MTNPDADTRPAIRGPNQAEDTPMKQENRQPELAADPIPATRSPQHTVQQRQVPPVGPVPSADVCLVGALLYASTNDTAPVLALVLDDDVESPPVAAVLAAVRALAANGAPIGPQLIADELRRIGRYRGLVPDALRSATTSGADQSAARHYAAAVVAGALRRRVESAGAAFTAVADDAAEADLTPLAARLLTSITECQRRLETLRGQR